MSSPSMASNPNHHSLDAAKAASPENCKIEGLGLHAATVRQTAKFTILAHNESGEQIAAGGDTFFVAIRGASRVRARITDNSDGTYAVEYKPSVSGLYSISVSIFGIPLQGSPFAVSTITPAPDAVKCELRGDALRKAVSRHAHQFEVRFRDSLGQVAVAEDLDVYVVPLEPEVATTTSSLSDQEAGPPDADGRTGSEQPGVGGAMDPSSSAPHPAVPSLLSTYRKRKVKIEVGKKPLICRAGSDLDSEQIGQLYPGQMVTVVQAEEKDDGSIRALVEMVDEAEATRKTLESWWQPRDAASLSNEMEGLWMSDPALYSEILSGRLDSARSTGSLILTGRREKTQRTEREQDGGTSPPRAGIYDPFAVPSQSDYDNLSVAGSAAGRPFSPGRGSDSTSTSRQKRGLVGWVTLAKGGDELVRKRERLDAGQRRLHMQQWVRRQRLDKTVAAADAAAKAERHKRGHDRHDVGHARKVSPYQQELTCDPSGIGFAFGGVEPGTLHAHGQLHEVHKVFYSVGRVGKYQLHVALRKQALPLPGSPFSLEVLPGPAHAHSTQLVLPTPPVLRGEVGTGEGDGCRLTFATSDKMGNLCREGGAAVVGSAQHADQQVTCTVDDKGNGAYELHWSSKTSGSFQIHVKINDADVAGSPLQMKLTSCHPELGKTVVAIPESQKMVAGEMTAISLTFLDQFDNVSTPSSDYEFGMALLPEKSGEKVATCTPFAHVGRWEKEEAGEEYKLIFTPNQAGITDLHVWCVSGPQEKQERTPMPGSPWQVLVQSGKPDATVSAVDGFGIDHCAATNARKMPLRPAGDAEDAGVDRIIAGDVVYVRPTLSDPWGNPANVPDGELTIGLEQPDGEEVLLDYQAHVKGGLTSYEIRHETQLSGVHSMHLRLHGEAIKGSPVVYEIAPAAHEAQLSIVESDVLPPVLYADADPKYSFLVHMRDRYGNRVDTGGATIAARLQYVKQGMHDSNALNAHNHVVSQEDVGNGSYRVIFGLMSRGLNFSSPLTVQVIINLDRDPKEKPNGIDLPPVVCTFGLSPDVAAAAEAAKADAAKAKGGEKSAPASKKGGQPAAGPAPTNKRGSLIQDQDNVPSDSSASRPASRASETPEASKMQQEASNEPLVDGEK